MEGFAEATIVGNLTRDPELRYTPSGKACLTVTVAVNSNRKVKGEKKSDVSFIDVKLWEASAEFVNTYAQKGTCLFAQGMLREERWENKTDGGKRSKLRVTARTVRILSRGKDTQGEEGSQETEVPAGGVPEGMF